MNKNLKALVYTALMTAFVFVTTSIIQIPIPFTGGYIHAGDMCIFVAGILLGPLYGGLAAGIGSALADLLGGYPQWVIYTLIIKTIMGALIGYFAHPKVKIKPYLIATMALWTASLLAFIVSVKGTQLDFIQKNVENLESLESAQTAVSSLNMQLLWVAIGIPVLILGLWLLKRKYHITLNQIFAMVISGIWMVLGYYLASAIMYGSLIVPIFSVPWNIVQFGVGAILAFAVVAALEKANINQTTLMKSSK